MVIVVFDISGNWRICNFSAAIAPTSKTSRLTTVASTGRRMKRSVKLFMIARGSWLGRFGGQRQAAGIVDDDGRVRQQLDLARCDHDFARFDALLDRYALAT